MQTLTLKQQVRSTAWHYLEPGVAACAGMTLAELQQLVAGTFHPTDAQLEALARRMSVPVETTP